jgi:hypothetical protein
MTSTRISDSYLLPGSQPRKAHSKFSFRVRKARFGLFLPGDRSSHRYRQVAGRARRPHGHRGEAEWVGEPPVIALTEELKMDHPPADD